MREHFSVNISFQCLANHFFASWFLLVTTWHIVIMCYFLDVGINQRLIELTEARWGKFVTWNRVFLAFKTIPCCITALTKINIHFIPTWVWWRNEKYEIGILFSQQSLTTSCGGSWLRGWWLNLKELPFLMFNEGCQGPFLFYFPHPSFILA